MELIKIEQKKIGSELIDTANARDLHEFLESKQDFSTWIKKRIKDYDFVDTVDFATLHKKEELGTTGFQGKIEYFLSIDMAKEISMVQNNEKGKQARKYFIECEKKAKGLSNLPNFEDPAESAIAWAKEFKEKKIAQEKLGEATQKIKEAQPKLEFVNHIETSSDSITVAEFAKLIYKKGLEIGQKRLFKYLYDQNYLRNRSEPYQIWMDKGLFEIKKTSYIKGDKSKGTDHKVMVTGKGQTYLTTKLLSSFQPEQPLNSQTQF